MKREKETEKASLMKPIKKKIKQKLTAIYDIESKSESSDLKGFERAILIDFYDGKSHISFRNNKSLEINDNVSPLEKAINPGGCIDKFLRYILGTNFKDVKNRAGRKEYSSKYCRIYAHNGGRFDATYLLCWLQKHTDEFEFSITCVQSRAQKVTVYRKNEIPVGKHRHRVEWDFIDSALLLPMSLKDVGKKFCPEKQGKIDFNLDSPEYFYPALLDYYGPIDIDESIPLKAQLVFNEDWRIYNQMDTEVLFYGIEAFQKMTNDMNGEMGITLPATSMNIYRRNFQKEIFERHPHFEVCEESCQGTAICGRKECDGKCHNCLHSWIYSGYHGGRVEIFNHIAPPGVKYFDLNSSYPASMLQPMPIGDKIEVPGEDFYSLAENLSKTHIGFVECDVEIPCFCHSKKGRGCYVPPLPFLCDDNKLRFPVGRFSGVFAYDELMCLFHPFVGGKINKVKYSVWYRKANVFNEFIHTMYKLRDPESPGFTEAGSTFGKDIMNYNYGKYGTKPIREEIISIDTSVVGIPGMPGSRYNNGRPIDGDHLNCRTWVIEKYIDAAYMIPQIAAQITALSRIRLWKAMRDAMMCGGTVYYCDTDSILTDYDIPCGEKRELGAWKREKPEWVMSAQFLLPKSYILENELLEEKERAKQAIIKLKGVKLKGAGAVANAMEALATLKSGGEVEFKRVEQHRSILKKGLSSPREIRATKRIVTEYDKRMKMEDGKTLPICLGMD